VILIVDNYDSFTFNLYQLVAEVDGLGTPIVVTRNDASTPAEIARQRPTHVLLSPGPGHPRDAALSLTLIHELPDTPVLGVCLGHQALAWTHGARVSRAPHPTHGSAVLVEHDGSTLFRDQPARFEAGLYHSLAVERASLPPELIASAWSSTGDIMALRHARRPHFGVQFHPESFLTPTGRQLMRAFLDLR
jgi:anthranilate synthase component II